MKFSAAHGLNQNQAGLDFVDIDPAEDIPLFFDPFAIGNNVDEFSIACANSIRSFFGQVLHAVTTNDRTKGLRLLGYLREPNEICFGYSRGHPAGRGVGPIQVEQLYDQLASSQAARTGSLSDLAECELFVAGFGPDKISDITANIIRGHLIQYTQDQCKLHGISDLRRVPIGHTWDVRNLRWISEYHDLPIVEGVPLLLSPKNMVRWKGDLSFQYKKYYQHFVLEYLKDYHLQRNTAGLVHVFKDRKIAPTVFKTRLAEEYPIDKDFLFRFSSDHPAIFESYKRANSAKRKYGNEDLDEEFDDAVFVEEIKRELQSIRPGTAQANRFHRLMVYVLEYLFYPNLIHPKPETPIHGGRKRIDITYTNDAQTGLFHRLSNQYQITCIKILVECKNYSADPANPELDQLSGRFGPNRGRFGLLVARSFEDRDLFLRRCRDTALDDRGFIVPLVDDDIRKLLDFAATHQRRRIDEYLDRIMSELTT